MTTEKQTIVVWIVVDESGEYEIGKTVDEAIEAYRNNIDINVAVRIVRTEIEVALPRVLNLRVDASAAANPADTSGTVSGKWCLTKTPEDGR